MPIINRGHESEIASTAEGIAGIVAPTAGTSFQPESVDAMATPSSNASKAALFSLVAAVTGVLIPFLVYFGMQQFSGAATEDADVTQASSQNFDLDIQRLQKIAAIVALTQKEYEMNTVSRAEAESNAEAMTLAALDAILDKNRRELADAKAQMAELLVGIHAAHEKSPKQVKARFAAAIEDLSKKDSPEVLRILQLGAKAVEAVPDGMPAATYFAQALDNNI
jgi:hypothetical protein